MSETSAFYKSLKQRIVECGEAYYSRILSEARNKQQAPKKASQCHKWLENFKAKHGMPYGIYRGMVKRGLLPPIGKAAKAHCEEQPQPPVQTEISGTGIDNG